MAAAKHFVLRPLFGLQYYKLNISIHTPARGATIYPLGKYILSQVSIHRSFLLKAIIT
ncbi:hypothetical protein Psfp_03902 [Pelotomaculum sp. FP]|nr:hypothetical protein Psfp_03902 [Pelotomaculum sp. FP]